MDNIGDAGYEENLFFDLGTGDDSSSEDGDDSRLDDTDTSSPSKGNVDRISSAVLRGVSHEGRLLGREACDQEQEGNRDTQVRQVQAVYMT